jgi:hypothetical protein
MGYDPHFPAHYPSKPSLDEVATMLRARTVDENGNEVGTFNDTTSPTATQAEQIIDSAYDLVLLRVGRSTSTTGGITSLSIQGATAGSDPDDPLPFAFYEQRDLDEFTP